jgi:hypothetical protein
MQQLRALKFIWAQQQNAEKEWSKFWKIIKELHEAYLTV